MILTRTDWTFLSALALKEAQQIVDQYGTAGGQISLTHRPDAETVQDKFFGATGSLYDYNAQNFIARESDFTVFNEALKNTYLHEIYNEIGNIGRMRIMVMDGPSSYTVHRDLTTRYHLVLKSNPQCFFVFPDDNELVHVPHDNNIYEVDTKRYHTFVNGSREQRIHLVMDNLNSYD